MGLKMCYNPPWLLTRTLRMWIKKGTAMDEEMRNTQSELEYDFSSEGQLTQQLDPKKVSTLPAKKQKKLSRKVIAVFIILFVSTGYLLGFNTGYYYGSKRNNAVQNSSGTAFMDTEQAAIYWAKHPWKSGFADTPVSLGYISPNNGYQFSSTSTVSFQDPDAQWETVTIMPWQSLKCGSSSMQYNGLSNYRFYMEKNQPFVQYWDPEHIYMVDSNCNLFRTPVSEAVLSPLPTK
jgi:hypothetical protein